MLLRQQLNFYLYNCKTDIRPENCFYFKLFNGSELIAFDSNEGEESVADEMVKSLLYHIKENNLNNQHSSLVCSIKKGKVSSVVEVMLVTDDPDNLGEEYKLSEILTESFDLITEYFLKQTTKSLDELLLEYQM